MAAGICSWPSTSAAAHDENDEMSIIGLLAGLKKDVPVTNMFDKKDVPVT